MTTPTQPTPDRDPWLVGAVASAVSLLSLLYYFQHGQILLYGDAVAHINIARRVFDSQTPGLLQLGTVWLPLPHLLMIPFVAIDWMWRTGVGGSIPSMIAYVLSVLGIFRLTRALLKNDDHGRAAGWLAALIFGANPNLVYLQATAMTESLYLALFIWAVVYFEEFLRFGNQESGNRSRLSRPLYRCAGCVAGAELTRYDGWFLAAGMGAAVLWMLLRHRQERVVRRAIVTFLVSIAIAPVLWLAYNGAVYGNALEFANGPYSAKAIEQRTAQPGYPAHPGAGNVTTAASFFLKSAELDMAQGNWGRIWVAIAVYGIWMGFRRRAMRAVLFFAVPLVFYALSIAYSGVPLFVPAWWPFTWYNVRYGLQLLPLFAVSAALVVGQVALGITRIAPWLRRTLGMNMARGEASTPDGRNRSGTAFLRAPFVSVTCVFCVLVGLSYVLVGKAGPLCFKEAWVNSRTKLALESAVARAVRELPHDSVYLMYVGDHVGAFQQAGVPLRQVINEGNHRPWKKPSDAVGLWERGLADPAGHVDFVIAYEGDAVDQGVNRNGLSLVQEIHTVGQPRARIYAARAQLSPTR